MKKVLAALCLTIAGCVSCSAETKDEKVSLNSENSIGDIYLALVDGSKPLSEKDLDRLDKGWEIADVPMLLESMRFVKDERMSTLLHKLLKAKSGKSFARGSDDWQQWLWAKEYKDHPDYARFKGALYRQIDPKFDAYFDNNPKSTIRLDEIRWGGVVQDGIPPLRNPKMISAKKASYLSDSDIVFGIEVGGDFRAYPKRILAWHEMFTDTIQGVPLAGVY